MNEPGRHLTEDELTLFHYGELGDRAAAGRHVMSCPDCRGSYDELLAVLEAVDALPVPPRDAGYGEKVWNRIAPELPLAAAPSAAPRHRWAVAATLLLVLAAGYLAGRLLPGDPADPVIAGGPIPAEVRERILRAAVGEHLERSGRMLIEIANDGDTIDAGVLRTMADGLLGSNRLYRQTLAGAGQADLLFLLEDLERVLLDIAHSVPEESPAESEHPLDSIRARIDERGLLFKLRIVVSRLRQEALKETETTTAERA